MNVTIRREEQKDRLAVEKLVRQAFYSMSNKSKKGYPCDEHFLYHNLRDSDDCVSELNLVADVLGDITGCIIYSKAEIKKQDGSSVKVLTFGPLAIRPDWQSRGIGGILVRRSLVAAARLGYGAVLIYGHVDYYPRFGFLPASKFGITTHDGQTIDALMACELKKDYLASAAGSFHISPLFFMKDEEVKAYDRQFGK